MWWLRQHPKVQGLKFKATVKRQDRVNARVRYIEGDITEAEYPLWVANFEVRGSIGTSPQKWWRQFSVTLVRGSVTASHASGLQ